MAKKKIVDDNPVHAANAKARARLMLNMGMMTQPDHDALMDRANATIAKSMKSKMRSMKLSQALKSGMFD